LGILGSAVIGLIGLVATIDWDTAFHQARKTPFVWTALLFAIALASACGALIYQVRYQKTHASSAYSTLIKRLADHFAKR
jgi:prepilin signal peptidase PulO-like enzyme (type II secretory pathway)